MTASPQLTNETIVQLLQDNGISWKIYVHPDASGCATPSCLYGESYLNQFTYGKYVLDNMPNQFAPTTQLMTDIQNGTLPQVSFIEPAGYVGLDEHPTDTDVTNAPNVQAGAAYVESIVDGLMAARHGRTRSLSSPMTRAAGSMTTCRRTSPPPPTASSIRPIRQARTFPQIIRARSAASLSLASGCR